VEIRHPCAADTAVRGDGLAVGAGAWGALERGGTGNVSDDEHGGVGFQVMEGIAAAGRGERVFCHWARILV
jgi:hypothetical protein